MKIDGSREGGCGKIDGNAVKFAYEGTCACVYEKKVVSLHPKWITNNKNHFFCLTLKNLMLMQTDNYKKQSPINEVDGGSMSVHQLLTADEFIAQMEPRIRALFK